MRYQCELCGTIYNEETGDPARGIPGGTPFGALPEDYSCPGCGMEKEAFSPVKGVQRIRCAAPEKEGKSRWPGKTISER